MLIKVDFTFLEGDWVFLRGFGVLWDERKLDGGDKERDLKGGLLYSEASLGLIVLGVFFENFNFLFFMTTMICNLRFNQTNIWKKLRIPLTILNTLPIINLTTYMTNISNMSFLNLKNLQIPIFELLPT